MDSLHKRFRNTRYKNNLQRTGPEQIMDALLCLYNAVNEGTLLQAAPENIGIREDGTVSVTPKADQNIYYAAPEVALGKSAADKNSGWFTMGLLAYFVISGRSYYEAKGLHIVDLPDMVKSGRSLIPAQGASEDTDDIQELLDLAMSRFTSWEPEVRSEGASFLLKVIRQYTAKADIQYMHNGKVVSTKSKTLSSRSVIIAAGDSVTGKDGVSYRVKQDCEMPFRPGTHKYTVDVEIEAAGRSAASGSRGTGGAGLPEKKYLCIQEASQPDMSRLITLGRTPQRKWVEVDCSAEAEYRFYVATIGRAIHAEHKFSVPIPAGTADGKLQMLVTYNPPSECTIELYNRDGTSRLMSHAMRFTL